ncbi:hypothetical protein ASF49_16990 [Methylobacterium sp. Leaf104]|uniref:hypothetical protein n=1 Tax=Methylobacterium TaxID=407 RepID=UPI0006FC4B76|nr:MULTISPECIES: hypothetical protein [Methylobacterium]KQP41467.1 hypothetical protein ASF49_16990 [Methylobacterium sp. Leaf104]MCI9881550.1 hypothetical protein [Methylobacterium goesingense]
MGVESFDGLSRRPAAPRRWRRASRHRIGPLRSVSEAAPHPVLRGMRSGALAGLALVAVLGLPVLLVLTVKAPYPVADEATAPARVWAGESVARAAVEAPAPPATPTPMVAAVAESAPARAAAAPAADGARGRAPALSVDLIPVLDDESGALTIAEPALPAAPAVKPARAAAAKAPRTP